MRIETITTQEAAERLRALGMHISPENIRRGLEQGVYPFGDAVETKNGKYVYHIYATLFERWIEQRAS